MSKDKSKTGPKTIWEHELGTVIPKGRDYPAPIWNVIDKKETKITLQEMALNKKFEEQIQRLGAEQKAKRLSGANEKTPPK